MQIREVDLKVLFFCVEDSEIDLVIKLVKGLETYRNDLILFNIEWFQNEQGDDICIIIYRHTDGADVLQLGLYKQGIEID